MHARATNIRLRWSREGKWNACALQTFGSAGAGRGNGMHVRKHSALLEPGGNGMRARATNIRLRWSRGGLETSGRKFDTSDSTKVSALRNLRSAVSAGDRKIKPVRLKGRREMC